MYGRKEKKIAKDVKEKKRYHSYYKMMSHPKTGKPRKHTLTYAQWKEASPARIKLSRSGMSIKEMKRVGVHK